MNRLFGKPKHEGNALQTLDKLNEVSIETYRRKDSDFELNWRMICDRIGDLDPSYLRNGLLIGYGADTWDAREEGESAPEEGWTRGWEGQRVHSC